MYFVYELEASSNNLAGEVKIKVKLYFFGIYF